MAINDATLYGIVAMTFSPHKYIVREDVEVVRIAVVLYGMDIGYLREVVVGLGLGAGVGFEIEVVDKAGPAEAQEESLTSR